MQGLTVINSKLISQQCQTLLSKLAVTYIQCWYTWLTEAGGQVQQSQKGPDREILRNDTGEATLDIAPASENRLQSFPLPGTKEKRHAQLGCSEDAKCHIWRLLVLTHTQKKPCLKESWTTAAYIWVSNVPLALKRIQSQTWLGKNLEDTLLQAGAHG